MGADSKATLPPPAQSMRPMQPPTPPHSPDLAASMSHVEHHAEGHAGGDPGHTEGHTEGHAEGLGRLGSSHASLDTVQSTQSHKQYLDSLVVPPKEEIQRIAEVQDEREAEHRRHPRDVLRQSTEIARCIPESTSSLEPKEPHTTPPEESHYQANEEPDGTLRMKAATTIQRIYRGYRVRREMKGLGLNASTRWNHAIREAQWRAINRPRPRGETVVGEEGSKTSVEGGFGGGLTVREKWKKAAVIARRAGLDMDEDEEDSSDSSSESPSGSHEGREARHKKHEDRTERKKAAMTMGLPYFLEMVDLKHRYGSNLRTYHEEWKKADTNENFFYWLDYGEGQYIDMDGCPRERLDREQVRYLSREERQYYIVKVDAEGRLCWAKNDARIDTTEQWKDSIHGIVPADDPTPAFNHENVPDDDAADSESGSGASESELEAARAAKYATPGLDEAKGMNKVSHISAATIFNKLLRKSVKKNTWIFVADTNFRLYVGIKASGAFQHSSFLQGSRISAAGLIKIKNGRLASLSPLSGHYRPPASNFRAFVRSLREEGVDMSHVSISKSYSILVGLEAYVKTRRKGKSMIKKITHRRDKLIAPEEVKRREEEARDKSESAKKEREFLEHQRKEESEVRDENRAGLHLMQKLRIAPQEPAGGPAAAQGQTGSRREGGQHG